MPANTKPSVNSIVFAAPASISTKIRDRVITVTLSTDRTLWCSPIDTMQHMELGQSLEFAPKSTCRLWLWTAHRQDALLPTELRAPRLHPAEAVYFGEVNIASLSIGCGKRLAEPDADQLRHSFTNVLTATGRANPDALILAGDLDEISRMAALERWRLWAVLTGRKFVAATLEWIKAEPTPSDQLLLPIDDYMPGELDTRPPSREDLRWPERIINTVTMSTAVSRSSSGQVQHDADGVVLENEPQRSELEPDEGAGAQQEAAAVVADLAPLSPGADSEPVLDRIAARLSGLADQRRSAPFWAVAQWADLGPGDDAACDGLLERLRADERFIVDAREGAGVVIGLRDPVSAPAGLVVGADAPAPAPAEPMLTDDQVQELIRYIGLRGDNVSVDELASRLSFWPLLPKGKKKRAFAIEVMESLSTQYLEFDRVLDPHAPPRVWLSDDARRDWTGKIVRVVSETFARSSVDVYAKRLSDVVVEAGLLDSKSWAKVIVVDELERMGFIRRVSELGTPGFGPFKRCAMSDSEAADVLADVLGRRRRGHSPEPAVPQTQDESALVAEWLVEVRLVLETEGSAQWLDTLLTCDPYSPMEPMTAEQALAALQTTDWAALSDEGDAGEPAWLVAFKG